MKKVYSILFILCIYLSLGLIGCGRGKAEISNIYVSVVLPNEDNYSSVLSNKSTLTENDYILQVEENYHLTVEYVASSGSQYPVMSSKNIKLYYDTDFLEISQTSEDYAKIMHYNLICKRSVAYTTIIVEVDGKYFHNIIISTK